MIAAPIAEREPRTTPIHNTELRDDYAWLRDKGSDRVTAYLEAENAYTAAAMAGTEELQKQLYDEILSHIKEDDTSVPYRDGDWLYWTRTEKGKQYATYLRRLADVPDAPETVLLDVNQLADGHPFMQLGALAISPSANLLAYTTDNTGFRQYTLHVLNLTTREELSDTAERVGSIAWAADCATLFFTTEDDTTKRQDRLFRLALGGAAVEIFHEEDERFNLGVGRTTDRSYILLESGSHTTNEIHLLSASEPEGAFQLFAPRVDDEEYHVDHRNGFFYIRTNREAEQFRLMRVPSGAKAPAASGGLTDGLKAVPFKASEIETQHSTDLRPGAETQGYEAVPFKAEVIGPREDWEEIIPENPDAPFEDFDLFQNFLVASYRERGLPTLHVFGFDAQDIPVAPRAIAFPDPAYEAYSEINRNFNATSFRYAYQSLVRPASVFSYDVATQVSTLLKQQEVPGGFDAAKYSAERVWFAAADGTQVPVSLVYRSDTFKKDATAPLYVYGYGSYGYPLPLGFSASRLALLDRGVVVAYAHIRGGGELGDPWHDGGKMMAKRNTFTDFIEATEFLLKEGYGDPARVAIEGGSAGGLLMGAVVNMRPELFRAVLSHVPFVDVMNTMLDATLPLTVAEYEEWGNPNEPAAFAYMLSYSPYENLDTLDAARVPAMLVKTSLNDSQVMYWEPAKYVAKLRTLKTNDTPLLLHINMEAGHGGASGRYDYLKEIAFDDAFLLRELGAI